jgi:hypothetical protein
MTHRSLRVCAELGCPELCTESRCLEHKRGDRRRREANRPSFRERGYDRQYDENRRRVLAEEIACYICGGPVDKALPGTHRDGPTADHVIRRADGGTNARENLRLAHLRCNAARHGGRARRIALPEFVKQPGHSFRSVGTR